MKHVNVQKVGSEYKVWEIHIQPGATTSEILTELNMEHYQLAVSPNATEGFNEEEDVYAHINDGDTLYALTSTNVADKYILSFFNKEGEYS
jgi:thiamine biosynthesis lipoprotein ApbE